jgi:hypothetical protein
MLVSPLSILDLDHIPPKNHALPAKAANSSVLVVADDQEVSGCKASSSVYRCCLHLRSMVIGLGVRIRVEMY